MIEDGLYIFRCTVVNGLGIPVSDRYLNWASYRNRYDPERAIRTYVKDGVVHIQGHDYVKHYQDYSGTEYDCYTIITELDQLQTGLLPYPERS